VFLAGVFVLLCNFRDKFLYHCQNNSVLMFSGCFRVISDHIVEYFFDLLDLRLGEYAVLPVFYADKIFQSLFISLRRVMLRAGFRYGVRCCFHGLRYL
jgi:hypothetical protein